MADTDFTLEGPKWGSSESGTAGGTVTWAVDSSIPEADLSSIKAALAEWSAVANIQFQEVASTADANIDFKSGAIDGAGSVLGETGFSFSGGQLQHADVEFDSGDNLSGSHLTLVAAHEIGHAIGLGHFDSAPAVMNSAANFSLTGLTQSDIDGIQTIYGANTTTTSDAGATPDNPNPDPANGTGGTGTSGTPAPGMTAGSGAAGGCDGMQTALGDDGTASATGSGAGDGSFHHGHGAHHGGGSHANDVAALLQALQGDHAGAAGSAAGDGGFQHGHGGAASNDLAALLQTMQSDHASAVTASANEVHSLVPADMGSVTHAHFEHMWT
jgi:hypothetical protein